MIVNDSCSCYKIVVKKKWNKEKSGTIVVIKVTYNEIKKQVVIQ